MMIRRRRHEPSPLSPLPEGEGDVRPHRRTATSGLALLALLTAACGRGAGAGTPPLLDPGHPAWAVAAPDTFLTRFTTTRGDFVLEVVRAWAPLGADRFHNLVRLGYYDDTRFHRVVPGFIVQWGLSGDPAVNAVWTRTPIPDDPVVARNDLGAVAYAFTEPGTRSTQIFISVTDNSRLDAQGFAPFGRVIEGMDVVRSLYGEYGERSGGGMRAGAQDSIILQGNAWLDRAWPALDRVIRAEVVKR